MPDKSNIASTTQHVDEEIWPKKARLVTITEVMTEPKAEAKINDSAELEKFKPQIFLVKTLPIFRNPTKIKRNRRMSICGLGGKGLVTY